MATLQDSIFLRTKTPQTTATDIRRHVLIYFIPGNPGLIEFYRPFFTHLHSNLEPLASTKGITFTVAGNSLAGFHASGYQSTASDGNTLLPLNLEQQIEDVESQLLAASSEVRAANGDEVGKTTKEPTEVILVGHSVGSYILMSLLQRQTRQTQEMRVRGFDRMEVIAGICLFPTVVDLYASPSGRKAGWIAHIRGFGLFLHVLAKLLCRMVSFAMLTKLVRKVTGQPEAAAQVTAGFLASPLGVWQAIYLAQHELLEMREDGWSNEVWGTSASPSAGSAGESSECSTSGTTASDGKNSAHPSEPITGSSNSQPSLFFYWGSRDHWIANPTRDAIIARRAATPQRPGPAMEIDMHKTPHDFCVREEHSVRVAEKVSDYVRDVLALQGA